MKLRLHRQIVLFTLFLGLFLTSSGVFGQTELFPGEAPVDQIYLKNGDFGPESNGVGAFSSNFNRARGIISIGVEVQSDKYATWDRMDLHFYYGGAWHPILSTVHKERTGSEASVTQHKNSATNSSSGEFNGSYYNANDYNYNIVHTGFSQGNADRENNYYLRDMGSLERYNFNYNPEPGTHRQRTRPDLTSTFGIQMDGYTATSKYPTFNHSDPSQQIASGYNTTNVNSGGNVDGVQYVQYSFDLGVLVINISNLPPEMISSSSFKVRTYVHHDQNKNSRVCIATYNNPNPLTQAPIGLTASKDKCGKVILNWSNASNSLPTEATMVPKTAIFRNGVFIGQVADGVSTYSDNTAVQDEIYNYSLRHLAYSQLGKTYYKSNPSSIAEGHVKPRPDVVVSPVASEEDCTGKIEVKWEYNASAPKQFIISRSTNSTSDFVTQATVGGTERLWLDPQATRGVLYYYKIHSVNSCDVLSNGAALVSGISPADPALPTNILAAYNHALQLVDLTWKDNANNESKYQIIRQDDLGNTVYFDESKDKVSFTDDGASTCRIYQYKLRVYNVCVGQGLISISKDTVVVPPPSLDQTFNGSTNKIVTSKGYFPDRVEISFNPKFPQNMDQMKVYRKILGSSTDSVLISSQNPNNGLFIDYTADAGVYYEYTFQGQRNCNGTILKSNVGSDIGFRKPFGQVSGHVEYDGGIAVNGAKIKVEPTLGIKGKSVILNPGGSISQINARQFDIDDQMRAEFWFKPISTHASQVYVNKPSMFKFERSGTNYVGSVFTSGGTYSINVPESQITINNWKHVSMQFNTTEKKFKVYLNGLVYESIAIATANSIADLENKLVFGSANAEFQIEEFRLLNETVPDTNIFIDHSRFIDIGTTGMRINLRFDEGTHNYIWDGSSKDNVFNANHFLKESTVTWSNNKPTQSQLGFFGLTDALGNYTVPGVAFSGSGENFTIIPSFLTHTFSPSSRSVFMGDQARIFNNQDFDDESSFLVTGSLYYGKDSLVTSCPVPGVPVKIDGVSVVRDGQLVVTDDKGLFSLNVPIGEHFISVDQQGHTMEVGRFPIITGKFDFQENKTGIKFTDSTKRSIIGRVVGGLVETNKFPENSRSKNNIGVAKIRIVSPIAGTPCYSAEVFTDSVTGDYKFEVPPLQYRIDSLYVVNAKNTLGIHTNADIFTNGKKLIDLRSVSQETTEYDSIMNTTGGWTGKIDSSTYHLLRNFTYRSKPSVWVRDDRNLAFVGEDSLKFGSSTLSIRPTVSDPRGVMGWPVFLQGNSYNMNVYGNEVYVSADDNSKKDTVPLSGKVKVTNGLLKGGDPNPIVDLTAGKAIYPFIAGDPNTAKGGGFDFTKTIQVVVEPSGAPTVTWEPNKTEFPSSPSFRAYVLGSKVTGTGIATQGPEMVDYILRDPPGSGSSATYGAGTSTTKERTVSISSGTGSELSAEVKLGTEFEAGFGVTIETSIEGTIGFGMSIENSMANENTLSETTTTSTTFTTRDDPDNVGSKADIFIGKSRNWLVGPTLNVELVELNRCSSGLQCFGPTVASNYRMALVAGYAIAPNGIRTRFAYTTKEIEETAIPALESLRKSFLTNNSKYHSHLGASNEYYGINNDDLMFPQRNINNPKVNDAADTTGSSYTFNAGPNDVDSVRLLNVQIAIWKKTLAKNEQDKHACLNKLDGAVLVDNFTLGSAILSQNYSSDVARTNTESFELAMSQNIAAGFALEIGGAGFSFDASLTVNESTSESVSKSTGNSTTFDYTLTDGDDGDVMSIDVYKAPSGFGNVFITRGGQTMCPYEDEVVFHYFNPSSPTAIIGSHSYNEAGFGTIANATVQREEPDIQITPANQFNIPANQQAVYQLQLTNQSVLTVNNDIDLRIYVASQSNPHGAIVKIDGLSPNTNYTIPTGASVIKTLTVERGPIEINYDSLMIIFASTCSNDIADTAYISAHFIPSCTELSMTQPPQNWVFNNSINNNAIILNSNYNYNYGAATDTSTSPHTLLGFNKIGLEFKPASTSIWTEYQSFYKYPGANEDTIPTDNVYALYNWNIKDLPDGQYDLKSKSYCLNKDGTFATKETDIKSGIIDRINPHPFGTPSPADGILDPNDDITIQFNEPIDIGSLGNQNFDVIGVLNGGEVSHNTSLYYDGADDYAVVSGGANLERRNFTIEFWAKRDVSNIGAQTVFHQGTDANNQLNMGYDDSGKFSFSLGNSVIKSNVSVVDPGKWHHYAVAYDFSNQVAELFIDATLVNSGNTSILHNYRGGGPLYFGKNNVAASGYFKGNAHGFRMWNKLRTAGEVSQDYNKLLARTAKGLLYSWRFDEAEGQFGRDHIRLRDAQIVGPQWIVSPSGSAAEFDGTDDYFEIETGTIPITAEMDFTMEFWFNSTQAGAATLISNGKADGLGADSLYSWNIDKDANGNIIVRYKGLTFVATNQNYFDGKWHNFAMNLQRTGNLSSYIDGYLQNSMQAESFGAFSGGKMFLGTQGYYTGVILNTGQYFQGHIDEFRFWNTSRTMEQIKRDKRSRLQGDEGGLIAFVPFEDYEVVLGVPVLTGDFLNHTTATLNTTNKGATLTSLVTPTLKLPRPVQKVNFVYSLNNDKIVITPTTSQELIENVTLDITVKNVYDKQGNKMQSPKTWIAYINKNQVKWADAEFSFDKSLDSNLQFTAGIINSGGASKVFTISNLPTWLSVDNATGTINPNSSKTVTFTVSNDVNIGNFTQDVFLTTDFNFSEKLAVNLKVRKAPPNWTVNPSKFQYSMSIFGELKMDDIISSNTEDKLVAYVNGQVTGVATLQYVSQYDKYLVYLNVYSNSIQSDSIEFQMWNSTKGEIYVDVIPGLVFEENSLLGSPGNPQLFVGTNRILKRIPISQGWSWVSFPLNSSQFSTSDKLLKGVNVQHGDVIKGLAAFDQYDSTFNTWTGSITSGGGFNSASTYKIHVTSGDTIKLLGTVAHPDSVDIIINPGWNWLGFVSPKNLDVQTAMANYDAQNGDVIKSQFEFSYFDDQIGWVGSLNYMKSGHGYMLKAQVADTFNFPISSLYGPSAMIPNTEVLFAEKLIDKNLYAQNMSVVVATNLCKDWLTTGEVIVGALDQNMKLRGYASPLFEDAVNEHLFYITLYGAVDGDEFQFVLIDTLTGDFIETGENISFNSNGIQGNMYTPVQVEIPEQYICAMSSNGIPNLVNREVFVTVHPNPFVDQITIITKGLDDDTEYKMYNSYGGLVMSGSVKGGKEMKLSAGKLAPGVYYLSIDSSNFKSQHKIIKL
jgi:hypothetical protein